MNRMQIALARCSYVLVGAANECDGSMIHPNKFKRSLLSLLGRKFTCDWNWNLNVSNAWL